MELETAITGMLDAENQLRTKAGIENPDFISNQMMRLAQYLGAVEEHLAEIEEQYEVDMALALKEFIIDKKESATAAEKLAKIALGPTKGRIVYLSRLVGSGWRQVGVCQSRWNHLQKGIAGQI